MENFPDQLVHIDAGQRHFRAEDARIVQHLLNQLVQAPGGSGDALEIIAPRIIELGGVVFAKDLGEIVHGPQRPAQVVRDTVGEGFQLADRFP